MTTYQINRKQGNSLTENVGKYLSLDDALESLSGKAIAAARIFGHNNIAISEDGWSFSTPQQWNYEIVEAS